jgi:beta-glucanase (GH16 family)
MRLARITGTLLTLVAVAAGVVASGPVSAGAQTGAAIGAAGSYTFDDEFDGAAVDTAAWHVLNRGGDASNHEAQCYLPGNVSEAGGNLAITSKVDSSCPGYRYTSGMVQWATFAYTFGTIEIRAKQSGGQGSWPAQWLLGARCQVANVTTDVNAGGCNWPDPGSDEIDIAEFKTSGTDTVLQNVVSGRSGFLTCTESVSPADANWHVYALTRTPSAVTWSVDGAVTCTQRTVVPTDPMFLIMNNAMGGDGGGAIVAGDFPQTMLIDYVRVKKT